MNWGAILFYKEEKSNNRIHKEVSCVVTTTGEGDFVVCFYLNYFSAKTKQ